MRYSDGVADEDLYALLGVNMSASPGNLKAGHRCQAQRWHPDRNPDPAAKARMAAINNAFKILSDVPKRRAYDEVILLTWKQGRPAGPVGGSHSHTRSAAQSVRPGRAPGNGHGDGQAPGTATSAAFLKEQGFRVVDGRSTGGALWVVDAPGLVEILDTLRHQGLEFEYSAMGGMATAHRPAWWTRSWG
ncbi:MAG: J domain-containing protein [Candidatus Dormiibacterota bacterium]